MVKNPLLGKILPPSSMAIRLVNDVLSGVNARDATIARLKVSIDHHTRMKRQSGKKQKYALKGKPVINLYRIKKFKK